MPLEDVQGQPRALEALRGALRSGAIHHAWLFGGPEGVGKELAAVGFAQALLCETAPMTGCGTCIACVKVARRNHPDVSWVMPEAEQVRRNLAGRSDFDHVPSRVIKVDQVRALLSRLALRALEGRYKVAIVVSAELMNDQGQNALLKTLEEPSAATITVLIAAGTEALLPTIRSRCSRVMFGPLPREMIAARLQAEKKLDAAQAAFAAELSGGSMSRALAMKVDALEDRKALVQAFEAVSAKDLSSLLRFSEVWGESREEAEVAMRLLQLWTRDLALVKAGAGRIANSDLEPLARQVAAKLTEADIHRRDRLLRETLPVLSTNNASPRLQWEKLLVQVKRAERRGP
jgi:DNA polymerase-3 subunit delta'